MEENGKEIREKALISKEERTDETPEMQTVETPEAQTVETSEAEIADTSSPAEKKQTPRRRAPKSEAATPDKDASKKEASPQAKKEASLPRLKASLRHGFQLKGHYYSRAELGRKSVLAGLRKKYPGLFEK